MERENRLVPLIWAILRLARDDQAVEVCYGNSLHLVQPSWQLEGVNCGIVDWGGRRENPAALGNWQWKVPRGLEVTQKHSLQSTEYGSSGDEGVAQVMTGERQEAGAS